MCIRDREIYVHGRDTSEIISLAEGEGFSKNAVMYCDSAEPDRIKTWRRAGYRAVGVKKEPGSVNAVSYTHLDGYKRQVRQFRSGECAPQGVAMPCGKGGTMRLCRFGTPFESDTAFGHSPARRARRKGGCIGRRDPIEKRSGDVCRRRVRRLGISARTAPKVSRIRKDSDCGVSPSGA